MCPPHSFHRSLYRRRRSRGLTTIEVLVVVMAVFCLGAVAVQAFHKRMRMSQSVEAFVMLNRIGVAISSSEKTSQYGESLFRQRMKVFVNLTDPEPLHEKGAEDAPADRDTPDEAERESPPVVDLENARKALSVEAEAEKRVLCGSAEPVPLYLSSVQGKAFDPSGAAWATGNSAWGWRCLGVERRDLQHYQYGYDLQHGGVDGAQGGFVIWARGDLDGDGRTAQFRLRGNLVREMIQLAPRIEITDQAE